jgi:hypothetical protein
MIKGFLFLFIKAYKKEKKEEGKKSDPFFSSFNQVIDD